MSAALINALLKAMPTGDSWVFVIALAAAIGEDPHEVIKAMGRLHSRGLVERRKPNRGGYRLTKAGRAAKKSGAALTSGPNGPFTGRRAPQPGTLRARLWSALRKARKATVPELVSLAAKGTEKNAENNAQRYLRALVRAGYVTVLKRRAPGTALTSPGFKRYLLSKDTGPRAPVITADGTGMYDPNLRQIAPWERPR